MARRVLRHALNFEWDLIDPEADEILLGLLAHDNEPPPKHEKPHRRWVSPPMYPREGSDFMLGTWRQRASDWWEWETFEDYHKPYREEREAREAERDRLRQSWYTPEAQEALRKHREAEAEKARSARLRERGEQLAAVLGTINNAPPRRQLTPLPGPPIETLHLMWGGWKIEGPQMIYGGWPAYWWSSRLRR